MQFHILVSRIHKWAALLVGIQVLFWVSGGLVMSWFEIEEVRGSHLIRHEEQPPLSPGAYNPNRLADLLETESKAISNMKLETLYGSPVLHVTYMDKTKAVFDPQTGAALSPFPEDFVKNAAESLYVGPGSIANIALLENAGLEYRGSLPVWKVDFSDAQETSLYFHPDTGTLLSVRTNLWRFYDFMWMLHIMDYETRDDFNHPLLYIFAFAALLFTLTGFVLLYFRLTKRDLKWISRKS